MSSRIHKYICFNFYTGWREIDQFYKSELGAGLSPQITYILQICSIDKDMTINEVSSQMKLNASAASNLIARMEKKGLVQRTFSTKDRRVVNVRLTQIGCDLMDSLKEKIITLEDKISNNITLEEKQTLLRIVTKISNSRADSYS